MMTVVTVGWRPNAELGTNVSEWPVDHCEMIDPGKVSGAFSATDKFRRQKIGSTGTSEDPRLRLHFVRITESRFVDDQRGEQRRPIHRIIGHRHKERTQGNLGLGRRSDSSDHMGHVVSHVEVIQRGCLDSGIGKPTDLVIGKKSLSQSPRRAGSQRFNALNECGFTCIGLDRDLTQ